MIIVEIAGFLGADPEERFTANGKRVVTLRVATRVREGGQDETVWWSVNVWDDRFSKMIPHLKKGSAVIVIGKMARKPKTYSGRDGNVQISLNINADIIEFSPFGKPGERTSETASHHAAHAEPEDSFGAASRSSYGNTSTEYAGAGASQDAFAGFAGDDLPF
jgi:single-strand DNA-binding protein